MSGPQLPAPAWLVGCGHMAGAMVEGWRSAGVDFSEAVVIRPSGTAVEGIRTVQNYADAGIPPKLVVLGFKPQQLDAVAPELARWVTSKTTIVSILAGVEAASLRARFAGAGAIVRAMPNLPVSIRRGVIGLYRPDEAAVRDQLSPLFTALGLALWTHSDATLAAIGSLAGAGPAYVARFIRALARAGEARGLPAETAATIALETALGTAWRAAATGEGSDDLVRKVASPNGTTEAGLAVLDPQLDGLIKATIDAAAVRGAELAAEARLPAAVDSAPPVS